MASVFYTFVLIQSFLLIHLCSPIFGLEFPSSVPQCKFGDTECLQRVMTDVIRMFSNGNKELDLISIDPLFLERFSIIQSEQSPVNVRFNFRNITSHGLKDIVVYKVIGFERDPRKSKFEVFGRSKRLEFVGKYSASGKVLVLPITGNGFSNLTFENVNIHAKVFPEVETRDGKDYAVIERVKIKFTTSKFIPYFGNLFNDEHLSKNMNMFLQQNAQEIFVEVKASIEKIVADVVKAVLKGPFTKYPYNDLFLPD